MTRALPLRVLFTNRIRWSRCRMQLQLQIAVRCAPAPPVGQLAVCGDLTAVTFALQRVVEEQRQVRWRGRQLRTRVSESAQIFVVIVKPRDVYRETLVRLHTVPKLIREQRLRVETVESKNRRYERTGKHWMLIQSNVVLGLRGRAHCP